MWRAFQIERAQISPSRTISHLVLVLLLAPSPSANAEGGMHHRRLLALECLLSALELQTIVRR